MDGRLGRVHDEVSQSEAEALRGSPQTERFGPRPGEGLFLRPGRGGGRRLALFTPIFLFGLKGRDGSLDPQDGKSAAV